jgi:toxin HigB-1
MIRTIKHLGLKRLYEKADPSRIDPRPRDRVQRVLTALQAAAAPADMDLPGYVLHPLTGNLRGFWAVRVSGNWRVIFRLEDGHAHDVDLIDYH